METYLLFFIASVSGGVINALAGGGGLITFPLLMLVVGSVTADATSAIALFPAYPAAVWRTRNLLTGVLGSGWIWLLLIPSVLGGLIGALLLSHTGNRNFVAFVPWLVLLGTIIIALRPILVRGRESGSVLPDIAPILWPIAMAAIFVVALYGGYFGAGIGILMIGALIFISPGDIRHVVALKNFLNGWMRGVAVLVLALGGNVNWKYAAPMAIGGLVGGYIGGIRVASRKSHGCSLDRYRARTCRVSALLLEVIRPGVDAPWRRVGGNLEVRGEISFPSPSFQNFPQDGNHWCGQNRNLSS